MAIKNVLGSQGVVSSNVANGAHMVISVSDLQDPVYSDTDLVVGPVMHRVDDATASGNALRLTAEHVVKGNVIYIASPLNNNVLIEAPPGGSFYGSVVGFGVGSYNLLLGENMMLICFDDTADGSKWSVGIF